MPSIHQSITDLFEAARPKGPRPEVVSRVLQDIKDSLHDGPRAGADFDANHIAKEIDELENPDNQS